MKNKKLLQKAGSWILSAALAVSCLSGIPAATATAAVDVSSWQKEIYVDFGTGTNIVPGTNTVSDSDGDLDTAHKFGETKYYGYTCNEPVVAGYGTWLYDDAAKDVGTVYGGASNGQKIGFDRKLPAGVTNTGGNYFRDWVFSPDGTPYTFSVDLPAGQYEVYVYTGNKTSYYDNTTKVSLSDNGYKTIYDQTSAGGGQCLPPDCVYTVTITEGTSGSGYGTLGVKLFDDTIKKNEDGYDASYTDSNTVFYGTDANTAFVSNDNETAVEGKIVTARLNGIEIRPVETPVSAENITTSASDTNITVGVGSSKTLSAAAKNPETTTERLEYYSADTSIATVDPRTGAVTGVAVGNTTITAATPSLLGTPEKCVTYNVKVMQALESVSFVDNDNNTTTAYTMTAGTTLTVKTKVDPDNVAEPSITYSFNKETDIAAIDAETGTITAKKAGIVTIKAVASNPVSSKNKTATLTITPGFDISYQTTEISMTAGQTGTNKLDMNYKEGVDKSLLTNTTVSYSSDDENVAKVSQDGTVSALAVGTANITATADGGQTASYKVTVNAATVPATGINVRNKNITLDLSVKSKKTAKINASLVPDTSTDTLSSYRVPKNCKVIKVDDKGQVTALKPGSANITVKSSNNITTTVKVTVKASATKLKVSGKNVKKNKVTLKKGKKLKLTAKVTPSNSTDKVKWSTNKKKIASIKVTKKGVTVTAKKKGKAKITAKAGKKSVTITVTVK